MFYLVAVSLVRWIQSATMATLFTRAFPTGLPKAAAAHELSHATPGIFVGFWSAQSTSFVRVGRRATLRWDAGNSRFSGNSGGINFQPLRIVKVAAEGKGFGKVVLQKSKKSVGKSEDGDSAKTNQCPCGGGEEKKLLSECCGRYHGGVIEHDAETLMKARFSAYALGVVPYVVRTTHPQNPDFEGVEDFAADVKATCERLRFVKLETLEFQEVSETEAYVSFIVTYTILKGGRGERKYLKEKSLFVKENERWLYRNREPLSQASEAAWMASTSTNYVDPKIARKAFNKGTTTRPPFVGSSSGGDPKSPRINVKNRSGAK